MISSAAQQENIVAFVALLIIFSGLATWMHYEEDLQNDWGCKFGVSAFLASAFISLNSGWIPYGAGLALIGSGSFMLGCYDYIIPRIKRLRK